MLVPMLLYLVSIKWRTNLLTRGERILQTVPRVYSQNEVKQPVVVAERVSLRTTRCQGKTRARQSLLAQKYVK